MGFDESFAKVMLQQERATRDDTNMLELLYTIKSWLIRSVSDDLQLFDNEVSSRNDSKRTHFRQLYIDYCTSITYYNSSLPPHIYMPGFIPYTPISKCSSTKLFISFAVLVYPSKSI